MPLLHRIPMRSGPAPSTTAQTALSHSTSHSTCSRAAPPWPAQTCVMRMWVSSSAPGAVLDHLALCLALCLAVCLKPRTEEWESVAASVGARARGRPLALFSRMCFANQVEGHVFCSPMPVRNVSSLPRCKLHVSSNSLPAIWWACLPPLTSPSPRHVLLQLYLPARPRAGRPAAASWHAAPASGPPYRAFLPPRQGGDKANMADIEGGAHGCQCAFSLPGLKVLSL